MKFYAKTKTGLKYCDLGTQVIGHTAVSAAPDLSSKLVITCSHIFEITLGELRMNTEQ